MAAKIKDSEAAPQPGGADWQTSLCDFDQEFSDGEANVDASSGDQAGVFVRRLSRRFFGDVGSSFLVNPEPIRRTAADLKALDGVELLDATVGPVLLMGLRQLMRLRPPRPQEWLAFYLLSRKGQENDDSINITKVAPCPTSKNVNSPIL